MTVTYVDETVTHFKKPTNYYIGILNIARQYAASVVVYWRVRVSILAGTFKGYKNFYIACSISTLASFSPSPLAQELISYDMASIIPFIIAISNNQLCPT